MACAKPFPDIAWARVFLTLGVCFSSRCLGACQKQRSVSTPVLASRALLPQLGGVSFVQVPLKFGGVREIREIRNGLKFTVTG